MSERPGSVQGVRQSGLGAASKSNPAPQRLQLFRGARFDLQRISKATNGLPAIRIDRNSGWENPFLANRYTATVAVEMFRRWLLGEMSADELARHSGRGRFSNRAWLANGRKLLLNAMSAIRGKNIACWCKPRDACHGDVLLEIANALTNQTDGDPRRPSAS